MHVANQHNYYNLSSWSDSESSSSSDEEEFDRAGNDQTRSRDGDGFLAIEGKPGLFYKVELNYR